MAVAMLSYLADWFELLVWAGSSLLLKLIYSCNVNVGAAVWSWSGLCTAAAPLPGPGPPFLSLSMCCCCCCWCCAVVVLLLCWRRPGEDWWPGRGPCPQSPICSSAITPPAASIFSTLHQISSSHQAQHPGMQMGSPDKRAPAPYHDLIITA